MAVEGNRKEWMERSSGARIKITWRLVGHRGSEKRINDNIQASSLGDSGGDSGASRQVEKKQDVSIRLHAGQPGGNAGLAVDRGLQSSETMSGLEV